MLWCQWHPWWPKSTLLCSKNIPKAPGVLCQNFIEFDQAVMEIHYMTGFWGIASFSGLKTLFFNHIQPWQHLTQQIQLLLWQQHSWNSFQTSHRSHSWPHPLTGTPQSNMMISSCFTNQWMQNPTQLNWNMCSISWETLAAGNLTIGSQLAQLMRFQRRKSKLQPSWTTCPLWWITLCPNAAESGESPDELVNCLRGLADWCNLPSDEEKEWNKNGTDLSEPSMTRNSSRSCSHLTWWQPHLRCLKCAKHILPSQTTLRPWDWRNRRQSMP